MSGFQVLSFLDAYSGYNQIIMHPLDEEKTTFITKDANFCYRVMPFGLKITHRGIEANPDKCTAIVEMHSPTNIQEVHKLNGRLASLSRFLLKPFYELLKKTKRILWDKTCEQAFLAFKKTIATLPILSRPRPGAPLLLYLSIIDEVVSSIRGRKTLAPYLFHKSHTP